MAEFYRFFDSTLDDIREYNADEFAEYFRLVLTSGVLNGGTNLQVVASGGDMSVDVLDGFANINGYLYKVSEGLTLSIEPAHNTYDRIDRIVIRWDKREESRFIKSMVIKGVEAEHPVAPAITREGDIYDLAIAQVLVKAGKSYVSGANVTDERLNNEVCGLVNSLIQADTTDIFNQFQAWYNLKTPEFEKQWKDWFKDQQTGGYVTMEILNQYTDEFDQKVDTAVKEIEATNTLQVIKSNKDAEGFFTTVTYKRKHDNTVYCVSTLSGGTTPLYTTRTEQYYDATGINVVATYTYNLSYDADGILIGEE